MRTALVIFCGVCLAGALLMSGCKKDSSGPNDMGSSQAAMVQSAMESSAATDAFVSNDELAFADSRVAPTNYDETLAKLDSAVTPLRWGRFITSITRTATIASTSGDTAGVVRIERTIVGVLKIQTSGGDTLSKPFTDKSVRDVIVRRLPHSDSTAVLTWRPVATSLVSGSTQNLTGTGNSIAITQVVINAGGNTLTITNPLTFWLRYGWGLGFRDCKANVPEFKMNDSLVVNATVMSQSADTDMVVLRHGFGLQSLHFRRGRMSLVSQTGPDANGFYTRVYELHLQPRFGLGFFHVGIDAVTRATLYDSSAPYSVSWWGVPYAVR